MLTGDYTVELVVMGMILGIILTFCAGAVVFIVALRFAEEDRARWGMPPMVGPPAEWEKKSDAARR